MRVIRLFNTCTKLFAGKLTNQNCEYFEVNDNKELYTARDMISNHAFQTFIILTSNKYADRFKVAGDYILDIYYIYYYI